jgi:hypothetical protein
MRFQLSKQNCIRAREGESMLDKVKRSFVLFLLVTLLLPAAFAQHGQGGGAPRHGGGVPGPPPGPEAIEVPANGTTLLMQDFGGRPVVDLRINGKGPFRFILDTGASINVIDAALNEELQLPAAEGVQAAPRHGQAAPAIVSIQEIRVGDAVIRGVIGAVMPLSGMLGVHGPRGVLSAANFPGYLLTLNYPAREISIHKGKLEKTSSGDTFDYPSGDPLPTVPISVAGRKTRVHLDTGSGGGLTLPTKFLKELPLASAPRETGKARTHSGEYPISRAKVDGAVELGKHTLALAEIEFSDVRPGSSGPATGQIGAQVLRNFVVTLDTRSRRIRFVESPVRPA